MKEPEVGSELAQGSWMIMFSRGASSYPVSTTHLANEPFQPFQGASITISLDPNKVVLVYRRETEAQRGQLTHIRPPDDLPGICLPDAKG